MYTFQNGEHQHMYAYRELNDSATLYRYPLLNSTPNEFAYFLQIDDEIRSEYQWYYLGNVTNYLEGDFYPAAYQDLNEFLLRLTASVQSNPTSLDVTGTANLINETMDAEGFTYNLPY